MAVRGVPTTPIVVFYGSSDYAYYVSDIPIKRRGEDFTRIIMIPTEYIKWRYKIDDRNIARDISSQGTIEREYPKNLVEFISRNPENAIVIVHCNFDGTESSMPSRITQVREELRRSNSHSRRLRAELENLREEMKSLSEQLKMLRRRGANVEA